MFMIQKSFKRLNRLPTGELRWKYRSIPIVRRYFFSNKLQMECKAEEDQSTNE